MKKIVSIISTIALVFLLSSAAHSFTKKDPKTVITTNPVGITYIVDVHLNNSSLCNTYYVQVTDEFGNLVAPPKYYQEGITSYVFHEEGSLYQATRVAHLVELETSDPSVCNNPVYAVPASQFNQFLSGSTYLFNLYPVVIPGDD